MAGEIERTFAGLSHEFAAGGRGRVRRIATAVRDAPPLLLDRLSTLVVEHPGVAYDRAGVEELCTRQTKSIATAVGALQLALVTGAAATTLEGGPVLALGIDVAVGQVAAVVAGACDWYAVASYLVHQLAREGVVLQPGEIRTLTNAALVSRRGPILPDSLNQATELRLLRQWVGRGMVDALPFGSRLGRGAPRAIDRIEASDLPQLAAALGHPQ